MPKRSFEEKFDYYMKKMEKLKEKHRHKRRRLSSSSNQDELFANGDNVDMMSEAEQPSDNRPKSVVTISIPDPDENERSISTCIFSQNHQLDPQPIDSQSATLCESAEATDMPPLDPELLLALGEATDQGPIWGPDIHKNLSALWLPLLKKGMTKETREELNKMYLIPSNCTLLMAPKLNIEISAAITEVARLRDKKVEIMQNQLGVGIAAISRAMTHLLTTDCKIEAIKILSEGCRILCDLHNTNTQSRIKMITPGLAKPFLNVIQGSERDDTLFGDSLPEKIKASKVIEKQGLQIKKVVQSVHPRPSTSHPNAVNQQVQGNWPGPLRYSTNKRGGRGGQRKFTPSIRKQTTSLTSSTTQARVNQTRFRAPRRQ